MRKLFTMLVMLGITGLIFGQGTSPEILYYKFDGSGTSVPNEATNPPAGTATGTIVGGLSQGSTGLCGGALIGVGGSSGSNYLNTGWNTSLGTGAWTIMFWTNNIPSSSTLFYQFGDASAGSFRCFTNGVAGSGNWWLRGPVTDVPCPGCAPINTPSMTTFVYDPTLGNIKAYRNDQLVNTVSQGTLNINGSQFKVGGYSSSTGMASNQLMDEFRFYSRALDASEVALVYNQCLPLSFSPNDAGVTALNSPQNFCADTLDVMVTIKNFGTAQLDSCMVNWSIDGVNQTPFNFGGVLDTLNGTGPQDTMLTLGSYYFAPNTPYDIKVWTSMPNGVADTVNFNDTLDITVQAAITGNFTIGGAGADYANFSDAISDLNQYGVCGPVVFDVYDTTYAEQIELENIAGASATNTITFQAASGSPLVEFAAFTSTANYTISMSNTEYVTFDGIRFSNQGLSYGRVLDVGGGSSWNTFMNCEFIGDTTPTTTSTNMAVLYSSSDDDNNNQFLNNTIRGGSYGCYWYGSSTTSLEEGTVFEGNQFLDQYNYGMRFYYQNNIVVRDNIINSNTTYSGTWYRIFMVYCDGAFQVTGNQAYVDNYGYGIYLSSCDGSALNRGLVANNAMVVGSAVSTSNSYGIYCNSSGNFDLIGNSILLNSNGTNSRAFYANSGGNINVWNNIFYNMGPGYAAYVASPFSLSAMDYNDIYCPNGDAGYFNATATTFQDWQNASGFDGNGVSTDPMFYSMTDLHVCNDTLNGAGFPLPRVTVDFDGDMRDTLTPDIGADEFVPLAPGFLGADMDICSNDTVMLSAGSPSDTILWSTGATTRDIWVSMPGTYTVTVNGVCGSGSDTIVISASALEYDNFASADTSMACDGDTIWLRGDAGYDTYSWSNGATTQDVGVTTSGTYTLNVTDACGSGVDSVSVMFISAPTASFTHTTSFLTCVLTNTSGAGGGNATYSWDFGDGNTSTQMSPIHVYTNQGAYPVTLTVTNECGTATYTDTCNIVVVGIDGQLPSESVTVYPNPADQAVNVSLAIGQADHVNVEIFSATGVRMRSQELESVSGMTQVQLDINDIPAGLYFVKVDADGRNLIKKLVIQ